MQQLHKFYINCKGASLQEKYSLMLLLNKAGYNVCRPHTEAALLGCYNTGRSFWFDCSFPRSELGFPVLHYTHLLATVDAEELLTRLEIPYESNGDTL